MSSSIQAPEHAAASTLALEHAIAILFLKLSTSTPPPSEHVTAVLLLKPSTSTQTQ
jgi:hypothetical protein